MDSLAAAVEALVIGGRVLGLDRGQDTEEALLDALLTPAPTARTPGTRSKEWEALVTACGEHGVRMTAKRSDLNDFVLAVASAAQGTGGALAIDAVTLLPELERTARTWRPRRRSGLPRSIQRHHDRLLEALQPAIDSERKVLETWAARARAATGETSFHEVREAVREAARAASGIGFFRPAGREAELEAAGTRFIESARAASDLLRLPARLQRASSGEALALLTIDCQSEMAAVTTFLDEAQQFLNRTSDAVQARLDSDALGGTARSDAATFLRVFKEVADLLEEAASLAPAAPSQEEAL